MGILGDLDQPSLLEICLKYHITPQVMEKIKAVQWAAVNIAVAETEIRIHDYYWHRQNYIADNGVGPVSLELLEEARVKLAALTTAKERKY